MKIMFDVWYQLNTWCDRGIGNECKDCYNGDVPSPERPTDVQVEEYLPLVDEIVQHWENILNLGSNPDDGGQKKFLPGDDLILLSTQLLVY